MHYKTPKYRADIDGLRAIAILSVVAFHAFPNRVKGGFVGVDIFFVISGFLISTILFQNLERGDFSLWEFYARRIRRILPSLILVLLVCLMLGWLMFLPLEYKNLGKHVVSGIGFASNFSLLAESGYFDGAAIYKPLLHLWSLSIEEQFYLMWPLLLILVYKYLKRRLSVLYVILAASFAANAYWVTQDRVAAFYLPWARFWELLVGAALAQACLRHQDIGAIVARRFYCDTYANTIRNVLAATGAIAIMAAILLIDSTRLFPGYWALLPTIGTCLLIASGPSNLFSKHILSNRVAVFFGLISYPLYLWHWTLFAFLRDEQSGFSDSRSIRMLTVAISILLAWLTYRLVEKPIRMASSQTNRSTAVILLLSLAGIIGFLGAYIYANDGVASRFPPAVQPFLTYKYDYEREFRNGLCLIGGDQITFAPECIESERIQKGLPLVMIWGDSHGAQYYRALESLHSNYNFSLAQFTSSSCPPIVNFQKSNRPLCRTINQSIEDKIRQLQPAMVILAHDWPQSIEEGSLQGLEATVSFLKSNGVSRIVLIGPTPHWKGSLSLALVRYITLTGAFSRDKQLIPKSMRFGLVDSIEPLDATMSAMAKSLEITYVSPLKALCTEEGCLVRTDEYVNALTSFDNAHLTFPASKFVVEAIKDQLGGPFVTPNSANVSPAL